MRDFPLIFASRRRVFCVFTLFWSLGLAIAGDDWLHAGFLYDQFPTTLAEGHRTEAVGPFYYSQETTDESIVAVPPLFSHYHYPGVKNGEFDFLYPLLTYEYYEDEWRWQFFQVIAFAGGRQPDENHTRRFTLFPIYFQQRSADTNLNYTAVVPFYGDIKNRLFYDELRFVMFPIYLQTRRKDVVTDNYLFPIVHVRNGDGLHGWQVFPFAARERKVMTMQTNSWGDLVTYGGHDLSFIMFPFWISQNNNLNTENPEKFRASIPAFVYTRSPARDSTWVFWPFFGWMKDHKNNYHEWDGPWPFVIFARPDGDPTPATKTTSRVWPIFSQSHNASIEQDSYLWPIYRYKWVHSPPLDRRSTRIVFYLYVGIDEKNTETGNVKKRRDMWPFFTWRKDFNGNTRFQIIAPIESVLAENRGIQRNWSPIWSLWRSQYNPGTQSDYQSLLWNLYRRQTTPDSKNISLLFGLFQYQREGKDSRTRLFFVPVYHSHQK